MASAAPQASPESEDDLRKRIADLESQLDEAYHKLSTMNGNERPSKRARITDITFTAVNDDYTKLPDARIIRWQLQFHIDNLTDQIRWGNGSSPAEDYEDQWESKLNWYDAIADPLQLVLDVGIGQKTALKECNEILKMVADSFDALLACGSKMDTREELNESAASFELKLPLPWGEKNEDGKMPSILVCSGMKVENAWLWIWVVLLRVHATLGREEDTNVLLQCIRDCRAHEVGPGYISLTTMKSLPEYLCEISDSIIEGKINNSPDGVALAKLVKEGAWEKLRCVRRVRIMPLDQPEFDDDVESDHSDDDEDDDDHVDSLIMPEDIRGDYSEILDEGEEDNEEDNRKPAAIPNPDADGDISEEEEEEEDEEEEPEFNESSLEGDY